MTESHGTVNAYAKCAAKSYIQSVVFLDDRKPIPSNNGEESAEERTDFNLIVSEFAKSKIICSLVDPNDFRGDIVSNEALVNLCTAADAMIIDWDFGGDGGLLAMGLIANILRKFEETDPEQVRLIVVYTQEDKLHEVTIRLHQRVMKEFENGSEIPIEEDANAFTVRNCRIAVIGKIIEAPTTGRDSVKELDLPDRITTEFAKMASGLLSATVLMGLSHIRKNSHKILAKFSRTLDSAFMTHLMSIKGDEAFEHIIPVLVSEIESVLVDSMDSPLISKEVLVDWVKNVWIPGSHALKNGSAEKLKEDLVTAIELKFESGEQDEASSKNWIKRNSTLLLESEMDLANRQFAHLMSCKTFYGSARKRLTMGAIIKESYSESEGSGIENYFLCIQPACDCVRLTEETNFLFMKLKKIEDSEGLLRGATHIVHAPNGKGSHVGLRYEPKVENCAWVRFKPKAGEQMIFAGEEDQIFVAIGKDGSEVQYKWVDQLKPDHAQRAVEKFSSQISRVGLTESEWLRKLSER